MDQDVSAILAAGDIGKDQPSALDTLSKWQQLSKTRQDIESSKTQQQQTLQAIENAKTENTAKQLEISNKQVSGVYQDMLQILNLDPSQYYDGAKKLIENRVANGLMDSQRSAALNQFLDENKDNPTAIRQAIIGGVGRFLSGKDTLESMAQPVTDTSVGGGMAGRVHPSLIQRLPGGPPAPPITTQPGSYQANTLGPDALHTVTTVTDKNGMEITDTMIGLIARGILTTTGEALPGYTIRSIGGKPVGGGTGGGGAVGGGATGPSGPGASGGATSATGPTLGGIVRRPDMKENIDTFNKRNDAIPTVDQNTADNVEAYNLMRDVASGKGGGPLNTLRSGAVTLLAKFGLTEQYQQAINDKNYDLANKLLTKAMLSQPSAGLSVQSLQATGHAVPNVDNMNHEAMMSAVRRQIGINRMDNALIREYKAETLRRTGQEATGHDIRQFMDSHYTNNPYREIEYEGYSTDLLTKAEYDKRLDELGGVKSPKGLAYARAVARNQIYNNVRIGDNAGTPEAKKAETVPR